MYIYHIVLFEIFSKNFSAGVPLTYYHPYGDAITSVENLTTKFLEIPFNTNLEVKKYRYIKSGFMPTKTLLATFTNRYTKTSGDRLQVRAMKKEDVYNATGLTELQINMYLENLKYHKLFAVGGAYYLASQYQTYDLWYLSPNGYIVHLSQELRCSSYSFTRFQGESIN